uniref:Uncharacterized protein n=1 Tax=viral metagenome TaxID=1070528 RepID=A0A6M3KZL1_9ZZZZ
MTVTNTFEVEINGYKYKVKDGVVGSWLDPFPEQQSIGDPDYSNRRDLSSWVISDLRGGIGVEEMDEKIDRNKCWWANCIIRYPGHILPPRLAVEIAAPTTAVTGLAISNKDMEVNSNWTGGAQNGDFFHGGTYSWLLNDADVYQIIDWSNVLRSREIVFTCYAKTATASCARLSIADGKTTTYGAYHTGGDAWEQLTVTKTLAADATQLWVYLHADTANPAYFDDATLTESACTVGTPNHFANFNGELYVAFGSVLCKLASGRAAFTIVVDMVSTITALIPSLNSKLYIYLGDTPLYHSMTAAEVLLEAKTGAAYWGWQFDNKLFKCNTSGTVTYSTNPDAASPTWSAGGTITDIASQIESFAVGRDASGSIVTYCATNSILKVLNLTTPAWLDTEVRLPSHPNGGKGLAYWNGKLYISYGLGVKEYYPEGGTLLDIGLTERDGLPIEYNGEITKLTGDSGTKGLFALVDASQTTGNSKSGLYVYDGVGWQCWWVDTANNGAMNDVIVSSAESGYAVYWDCGGTIWYIDIPRGIENPDKITQSYAATGDLYSSWFDAGNAVAAKLAKSLHTWGKAISTTEKVYVEYRTNHTNTDLATGWTLLDTLNTTGENGDNEELFASGAGESINAIQFWLHFVTPGSTARPDIQSMVFYYKKRTGAEKIREWGVTVICDNSYNTTAMQKVANLKSAIESATDVIFSYHPNDASTESYYVSVDCPKFSEQTGRDYNANYNLTLMES